MNRLREALRVRFTPGRIAFATGLIVGFLVVVALVQDDDKKAKPDHAAALVPASALVYVHANVDPGSDQWKDASNVVRRLPALRGLRDRTLKSLTPGGAPIELEHQVYPWLGDEAALALLAGKGGAARSLILLEVSDRELANSFLDRAVGQRRKVQYRGVELRVYGQLATAFLGDFLAIGRPENVRAAIDAWEGRTASLALHSPLLRARKVLPTGDSLAYIYASRAGVKNVLGAQPGLTGRLAALVDDPALEGAAVALRPDNGGLRIDMSSVLRKRHFARAAQAGFKPSLVSVVPADAIAYVGARGADKIFKQIGTLVGRGSLSVPGSLRQLGTSLAGKQGAQIRAALQPLLQKEAALYVSPSNAAPLITLVIDKVNRAEADRLVERSQPLISRLIREPAVGQVPTFQPQRVAGLDAATLTISPSLQLTYAVFGGRAVVSTSPKGIRDVKSGHTSITNNSLFDSDIQNSFKSPSSLLFLDLEELLALGEQAGLGETPAYREFKADFSGIQAVTASTQNTPTTRKAAIFIEVK